MQIQSHFYQILPRWQYTCLTYACTRASERTIENCLARFGVLIVSFRLVSFPPFAILSDSIQFHYFSHHCPSPSPSFSSNSFSLSAFLSSKPFSFLATPKLPYVSAPHCAQPFFFSFM